jgi:ferric-dicitrate binding protein FerR (iron transport regulator)
VYIGNAIVLVDEQILFLAAYVHDSVPDAKAEAERAVSAWADAIQAANGNVAALATAAPAVPAAEAPAPAAAAEAGPSRTGLMVGAGLLLLGVVVLLVWLKGRRPPG